ncbi:hypothetical protein ACIPIC_35270 [Streptomyces collinus]|uniref:hypothetical protein n=1 Tax=Streptomyces collinus TaxID=42684 RepID=UPI0037FA34CE
MAGVFGYHQQVVGQLGAWAGPGNAEGRIQQMVCATLLQAGAQLVGQAGVVEAVQQAVVEADRVIPFQQGEQSVNCALAIGVGQAGQVGQQQDEGVVAQEVGEEGGIAGGAPGGDFLVGGDDVAGLAVADPQQLALRLRRQVAHAQEVSGKEFSVAVVGEYPAQVTGRTQQARRHADRRPAEHRVPDAERTSCPCHVRRAER